MTGVLRTTKECLVSGPTRSKEDGHRKEQLEDHVQGINSATGAIKGRRPERIETAYGGNQVPGVEDC